MNRYLTTALVAATFVGLRPVRPDILVLIHRGRIRD